MNNIGETDEKTEDSEMTHQCLRVVASALNQQVV